MGHAKKKNDHLDPARAGQTLGKTLFRLQDKWNFSNDEMARLIGVRPNTYGGWKKKSEIPIKKPPYSPEIELIIALLSTYRSLGSMFSSAKDQRLWLNSIHPDFGNKTPLEYAKKSYENVFSLKQYLDYIRGRGA